MTARPVTEDIVAALAARRDSVSSKVHTYDANSREERWDRPAAETTPLSRAFGCIRQYAQRRFVASVTPSAVMREIAKRPVMVGVGVAALVLLVGPARIAKWAAKAIIVWRLAR